MVQKVERSKVTSGVSVKQVTGCGSLYVTVNRDDNGCNPIEVFATLGKAGTCASCQLEALTRAITLGLKYGVPSEEYIEELKGIACPSRAPGLKETHCLSCADGVARVLEEYIRENGKV